MRQVYFFFAVLFLPVVSLAQNKYAAEALGFSEPMVIQKRVEKPGMTAEQIYRTFRFPERGSEVKQLDIIGGSSLFGDYVIYFERQIFFNVERQNISFDFYIYPHDGYYIVAMTDLFIQGKGRPLIVCGINGVPFRMEYSKKEYDRVVKIIDFANSKFEKFCEDVEEKAFGLHLTED